MHSLSHGLGATLEKGDDLMGEVKEKNCSNNPSSTICEVKHGYKRDVWEKGGKKVAGIKRECIYSKKIINNLFSYGAKAVTLLIN